MFDSVHEEKWQDFPSIQQAVSGGSGGLDRQLLSPSPRATATAYTCPSFTTAALALYHPCQASFLLLLPLFLSSIFTIYLPLLLVEPDPSLSLSNPSCNAANLVSTAIHRRSANNYLQRPLKSILSLGGLPKPEPRVIFEGNDLKWNSNYTAKRNAGRKTKTSGTQDAKVKNQCMNEERER
ncbi:putative RNA-dependent RNA polymerase 5-like protein [Corchorus capsularis]|uniref:Putative RNA-dependent RNA polymerase 5-like protein n=1 Tax=Corchorus capsularis TaxID=210143 RepID=A0A1R3JWG6_COCAP|nr:putative RNA-dependent RNA polymerase 5-like protein [Corchorus capsularis]